MAKDTTTEEPPKYTLKKLPFQDLEVRDISTAERTLKDAAAFWRGGRK